MLQAPIDGDAWHLLITPGAVLAVGLALARVFWVAHREQAKDRAETNTKLSSFDQALRGYDGEGGMLYDLRQIREARHTEASTISNMQSQRTELRVSLMELSHRVERLTREKP